MRKKLGKAEGVRMKFIATFSRLGRKINYKGHSEDTILLTKILRADTGEIITDHSWFSYTLGFDKAGLTEGCRVEFEARVKKYEKGYVNKQLGLNHRASDYRLSHPTKIKLISNSRF